MPKSETSEENGSPKRRYIPRPCILCTLNIRDHYLEELEAKIRMWVEMPSPSKDTLPPGSTEAKKLEERQVLPWSEWSEGVICLLHMKAEPGGMNY